MFVPEFPNPLHALGLDRAGYQLTLQVRDPAQAAGFEFGTLEHTQDRHYIYPIRSKGQTLYLFIDWYYDGSFWFSPGPWGQGSRCIQDLHYDTESKAYKTRSGGRVEDAFVGGLREMFASAPAAPAGRDIDFRSDLALRLYRQVFLGVDRPLGYTLDRDEQGNYVAVKVPSYVGRWYVRHADDRLPDAFLETLAREVKEKNVPGLSLASCRRITDDGMRHVAELVKLETLDLFNTKIGNAGLARLAPLTQLTTLNLAGTAVTEEGLQHLAAFPKLERLHLGWVDISDSALSRLANLKSLKVLELRNTKVTDAGMRQLASMKWLETLGLQETTISDAGVAALKPLAPTLVRLYVGYTQLTDACLNDLLEFKALRTLMLRATRVSRDQDGTLKKALTNLGGVCSGPEEIQEGLIR